MPSQTVSWRFPASVLGIGLIGVVLGGGVHGTAASLAFVVGLALVSAVGTYSIHQLIRR